MKQTVKNHLFLWKLCFHTAPGYMIYFLYDAFRYQFIIFLEHTLGIQYILHCAEYREPFWKALLVIGIILLINAIQIIPDGFFIHSMTPKTKPKLYQALKEKMYQKAAELDLSCYDDPDYYNEFVLAVSESEQSIDRFMTLLNQIMQSITVVFTTGIFYLMTDAAGILFVFVSFVLTFVFSNMLNKVNYKARLKINPYERKRNYVSRIFYLHDYAKELRLHPEVGDMLEKEFKDADDEIINSQKNISKTRVRLLFAQSYLARAFIIDGLYITYLVFQAAILHRIDYSSAVVLFNQTGNLRDTMRTLATIGSQANENSMYIDKIRAFLNYEPTIKHGIGVDVHESKAELILNHVSFRYRPDSPEILHDICLRVKPGEKIAIVGYNGAGKTTLIKLLMRLYDPTKGEILYGDTNIQNFKPESYRKKIGVVFQDYQIYGATLLENVVLDDVEKTEQLRNLTVYALCQSGFKKRLESLPAGLDTNLTTEFDENGVDLSGGESQKVAIARSFYGDVDILIMDEPSSALDPIAEYSLNKAMHKAAENKTVFYISHRLSTTREADRILMLEHGRIIEEGTHAALLAKNGKYAAMWQAQAGNYQ